MKRVTKGALTVLGVATLCCVPCLPAAGQAKPIEGQFEVTARLGKLPGKFPPDDLYDYAYVMQYQIVGGKQDGQLVYVAHYKPRRARDKIRDKMSKQVAGKLKRFEEGALHRMTLAPLKKVWKGAVEDRFFARDRKSPRYWCLKADLAPKK